MGIIKEEKDKIIKEKKELENQMNNDQKRVLEMQKQMQEIIEEKSNTDRELNYLKEIKSQNETEIKDLKLNINKIEEEKNKIIKENENKFREINKITKIKVLKRKRKEGEKRKVKSN